MAKKQTVVVKLPTVKKSNPGVHAKKKTSSNKGSKLYKKKYAGQGR